MQLIHNGNKCHSVYLDGKTYTCLLPVDVLSKSLETIRMGKEGGGVGADDGEVLSSNESELLLLRIVV